MLRQRAVGQQLESADLGAPRVVDVEHRLIGREGEAVWQYKIADQKAHAAEIGGDAVDAGKGQVPLLGRGRTGPRIGKIDAAIGFDDDVIGPIEPAPLEAVGDHRSAAVELLPGDTPRVVLAGNEPALQVSGQPISPVGRLLKDGDALAGIVFHPLVIVNVAEQQITAFFPPQRSFGRTQSAAEPVGQMLDRLGGGDDPLQFGSQLFDPRRRTTIGHGASSYCNLIASAGGDFAKDRPLLPHAPLVGLELPAGKFVALVLYPSRPGSAADRRGAGFHWRGLGRALEQTPALRRAVRTQIGIA